MANPEHVAVLRFDIDEWNQWRSEHPDLRPDLVGADLRDANLMLADLSRAILRNADLTMANLKGADLRGADLRTAEDLTGEQLDETIGDEATLLPDDSPRPNRWRTEMGAR